MADRRDTRRVREQAERFLRQGIAGVGLLPRPQRLRSPIPVMDPEGRLHSWFVPATSGGALLGFLQILPDLTLMRSSSFQRHPGSVEGCPEATTWLDSTAIRQRASARRRRGEKPGRPFLTYDRQPTRLVWAVPVTGGSGRTRVIFVAGECVYEARREPDAPRAGA